MEATKEVIPQETAAEAPNNKKKSKLPFVITLIVVVLLFAIGAIIAYFTITKGYDPDVVILDLINDSVKAEAENSFEGRKNAKSVGYVLDHLMLSKDSRVILWDSKNDCYALYDGETLVKSPAENPSDGTDMWIYVNKLPSGSPFSVYWAGTNKVTRQETVGDETVEQTYSYTNHVYTVTAVGSTRTYTCTEDGCGLTYSVTVK